MNSKHARFIKEALKMHYDNVELKDSLFICDKSHAIKPVLFTTENNKQGYKLFERSEKVGVIYV